MYVIYVVSFSMSKNKGGIIMVRITLSGDATFNRLSKEDLEDIAKYICSKNKESIKHVEVYYKEDADKDNVTFERVLNYINKDSYTIWD